MHTTPKHSSIFIASTGQHVGKTTVSLGLISALKKRGMNVGYMKPVGQEGVLSSLERAVDKDVLLVHDLFQMKDSPLDMSPVLLPPGFTKKFIDGKINSESLKKNITESFQTISRCHEVTVIEGTGHVGVGSIIELNNAQVAAHLKAPMLLVAEGGLGSSFDELEAGRLFCEKYKVPLLGVVLNRVLPSKREMVLDYMGRALDKLKIPLLGVIPIDPILGNPSMEDFAKLFQTKFLSGEAHHLRHFQTTRLVATKVEEYTPLPKELIITPASREEIVFSLLTAQRHSNHDLEGGVILTGESLPSSKLVKELQEMKVPALYVPHHSFSVLKKISSFVAKIAKEDTEKVQEAILVIEKFLSPSLFNLFGVQKNP